MCPSTVLGALLLQFIGGTNNVERRSFGGRVKGLSGPSDQVTSENCTPAAPNILIELGSILLPVTSNSG